MAIMVQTILRVVCGGKSSSGGDGTHGTMTSGQGFTWVNGVEYSIGGRGSDRQNSVNGIGPSSAGANTGYGGPSRYNSHYSGAGGGSGVIGIKSRCLYPYKSWWWFNNITNYYWWIYNSFNNCWYWQYTI